MLQGSNDFVEFSHLLLQLLDGLLQVIMGVAVFVAVSRMLSGERFGFLKDDLGFAMFAGEFKILGGFAEMHHPALKLFDVSTMVTYTTALTITIAFAVLSFATRPAGAMFVRQITSYFRDFQLQLVRFVLATGVLQFLKFRVKFPEHLFGTWRAALPSFGVFATGTVMRAARLAFPSPRFACVLAFWMLGLAGFPPFSGFAVRAFHALVFSADEGDCAGGEGGDEKRGF